MEVEFVAVLAELPSPNVAKPLPIPIPTGKLAFKPINPCRLPALARIGSPTLHDFVNFQRQRRQGSFGSSSLFLSLVAHDLPKQAEIAVKHLTDGLKSGLQVIMGLITQIRLALPICE